METLKRAVKRVLEKPGYLMVLDAACLALIAAIAPKVYGDYKAAKHFQAQANRPAYVEVMPAIPSDHSDEQVHEISSLDSTIAPESGEDDESTLDLIITTLFGKAVKKNVSSIKEGKMTERTWRYDQKGKKVYDAEIVVPIIDGVNRGIEEALVYKDLIIRYSENHKVPEELIAAIIAVESEGRGGRSSAGAQGLMQLMPVTARSYGLTVDGKIDERNDPEKNLDAGTHYISDLLAKYRNNVMLALAAYNWGETNIDRLLKSKGLHKNPGSVDWNSIEKNIPSETRAYALRVMSRHDLIPPDEITLK